MFKPTNRRWTERRKKQPSSQLNQTIGLESQDLEDLKYFMLSSYTIHHGLSQYGTEQFDQMIMLDKTTRAYYLDAMPNEANYGLHESPVTKSRSKVYEINSNMVGLITRLQRLPPTPMSYPYKNVYTLSSIKDFKSSGKIPTLVISAR